MILMEVYLSLVGYPKVGSLKIVSEPKIVFSWVLKRWIVVFSHLRKRETKECEKLCERH